MDNLVNSIFRFLLPSEISLKTEKLLKNIALLLGLLSAIAIIFDWYPLTMFLSFPFCLIWIYCAWLRTEPQLKWVNLIFLFIYSFGIGEDISFDTELIGLYSCIVHGFDPTPRSINWIHFNTTPNKFIFHDYLSEKSASSRVLNVLKAKNNVKIISREERITPKTLM